MLLGLIALVALAEAPASGGTAARAVVEETTTRVLAVLAKGDLSTDEKRHQVEDIVYAHVDFEMVARLVLARYWRRFSPAQQAEFVTEFKQHLSRSYGRSVENYHDEQVVIIGDRAEARGDWTVKTRIARRDADDVLVDYRLRQTDGTWKIIDIIVEGVSLVSNFRSQFQEILANGDPARLIRMLHDKNIKSEPLAS